MQIRDIFPFQWAVSRWDQRGLFDIRGWMDGEGRGGDRAGLLAPAFAFAGHAPSLELSAARDLTPYRIAAIETTPRAWADTTFSAPAAWTPPQQPEPTTEEAAPGRGFQATYYRFDTGGGAAPAAVSEGSVNTLNYVRTVDAFWEGGAADYFAAEYTGYLQVETAGLYTFLLQADDGAELRMNGHTIATTTSAPWVQKVFATIELEAGSHEIGVSYIDGAGWATLNLQWAGADTGGEWVMVSGDAVSQEAGLSPYAYELLAQAADNPGVGLADPSLAVGLSGYAYYKSPPFLNLMKQASPVSIYDADGNTVSAGVLAEAGLLDENGYPTALLGGNETLPGWQQGYFYYVSIHHPNEQVQAETSGDMVIEWRGSGTVEIRDLIVSDAVTLMDADGNVIGGRVTGTWPEGSGLRMVTIRDMDPDNHVRDISIVKAEYKDMYDAGAIFDPRYLATIQDHHTLRFMDWMGTNGSDVTSVADVYGMDSATWAINSRVTSTPDISEDSQMSIPGHLPFEVMVQLANEVGADPWFNIPLKADDDYVRALVSYVAEHLDEGLVAKFELSNEVWNWAYGFDQVREASLLGSGGTDEGDIRAAREYYGYRSAQIREIMTEEAPGREMQLIMGTQTVYYDVARMVETGVEAYYAEQGRSGEMSDVFDALAVTGYFSEVSSDEFTELRSAWYAQSEALFAEGVTETKYQYFVKRAADYLANGLSALDSTELALIRTHDNGEIHPRFEDPLEGYLRGNFAANKEMADAWGLELIQYEADSHISAPDRNSPDAEWYKALNQSAEMGQLTTRMAEIFREEGGILVNDFGNVDDTSSGLWGTRDYLADENPISAAYDHYNATAAATYGSLNNDRPEDAFLQGLTLTGTDQGDVLVGTAKRDYLLGGAGADLIVGGLSPDGINGGEGTDMVLFDGWAEDFDFAVDQDGRLLVGADGVFAQLVNVELIAFADSGEIRMVSDWTGEPAGATLDTLIADFAAGNPVADQLGLF